LTIVINQFFIVINGGKMKRTQILVAGLLLILTSCRAANHQTLSEVFPMLKTEEFAEVKHTISCNSLAPLALINHYYNDDVAAVTNFVNELGKTKVRRYAKLPESKNVACPTINTYAFKNEALEFTFDVTNMFVVKDDVYYELEELPNIVTTYSSYSFSGSTTITEVFNSEGKEITDFSLSLPSLEFKELTELSGNNVNFTIETVGGIISVYDAVTFGLNVGEQIERFYEVISGDTFANLFDTNNNFTDDTMLLANIPQQLTFRNQKYKMITSGFFEWQDIQLDLLIAYFVNERDYDVFYLENPDIEYCIDEANTLYYAAGPSKFPLYSLVGHAIEQLLGLLLPQGGGSPMIFLNISCV